MQTRSRGCARPARLSSPHCAGLASVRRTASCRAGMSAAQAHAAGGRRRSGARSRRRRDPGPAPRAAHPMAEDSPKRRKANFTEAETEALIALVLRHEPLLFAGGGAPPGQRRRLWEDIRRQVSPLAACPRDVEDLKKRWRDLKRRDRAKLRRLSGELQERGPGQEEEGALPTPGGTESPRGAPHGYIEQPGQDSQPSVAEMKLKEEIVVKIVEQEEEERSVHSPEEPLNQEHFPSIATPYLSPFDKADYRTSFQRQAEEGDRSGQDSLYLQQQQVRVMQLGFESVNHNLCLLQHSVQDLNSSVRLMARTLEAIKNVYVKNNAGPVSSSNSCTQTTAGYRSPASPAAEDRSRSHVTESSSRSSSRSSSGTSQERGPSLPLKNIKREKTNGDYYSLGDA